MISMKRNTDEEDEYRDEEDQSKIKISFFLILFIRL